MRSGAADVSAATTRAPHIERSLDAPSRLGPVIGYVVAAVFVILDQATKRIAAVQLVPGVEVPWISQGIGWQLVRNENGAFGLPAPSWFFLVITIVVTVIVVRNLPHATRRRPAVAYGLLLAGALGNALDRVFRMGGPADPRFFHGHVIDFVAWGSWPRFNVADISITLGFALLVLDLLLVGDADETNG